MSTNERAVPKVKLLRHLDLGSFGCECLTVGDINHDGRAEFVFFQGPGMLAADAFKPGSSGWPGPRYTTPADQALDCVTALDLEGHVLWQRGSPWAEAIPFRTHGGERMAMVADLAGDGHSKLVRIRGDHLEVLDGATGQTLAVTTLDNDGYSLLLAAAFTGDGRRQVVVKPCSDGIDGHAYGLPVVAYDHQLRPFWGRHDYPRTGHVPLAWDVDGDGRDELLVGFACANPDGSIRWTLPITSGSGHPDRRTVVDVNDDGRLEQVLACEDVGVVVSDLAGKVLWTRPAEHCGEACVGKFFADRRGLQILCNNEHWRVYAPTGAEGSAMLDAWGQALWTSPLDRYALPLTWPTAVGPQALLAKPHAADPPDARPFVMDGTGATIAEFEIPLRPHSRTQYALPHERVVWGDWGDYYCHAVVDLDGTGDRILIWTRRDLWVFLPTTAD